MFPEEKDSSASRAFQKGFDVEESRKHRETDRAQLRRTTRSHLLKKRRTALKAGADGSYFVGGEDSTQKESIHSDLLRDLDEYVRGCHEPDLDTELECCRRIRKLLALRRNPPIGEVIKTGVVSRLLEFAKMPLTLDTATVSPKVFDLQFEAVWCLTNIASGASKYTQEVVKHGGIEVFVRLIESTRRIDVLEQVIWAIGNIAGDSFESRNQVLDSGVIEKLTPRIKRITNVSDEKNVLLLRNACWALSNFTRGSPKAEKCYVLQCVPLFTNFLLICDSEIIQDALWGLAYVSDTDAVFTARIDKRMAAATAERRRLLAAMKSGSLSADIGSAQLCELKRNYAALVKSRDAADDYESERLRILVASGALPKVVNMLTARSHLIQQPCLRLVGNMTANEDNDFTVRVMNLGAVRSLTHLLLSERIGIQKEACWALSNVLATDSDAVERCIEANAFQPLVDKLKNGKMIVKREAVWALANVTVNGTVKQITLMVTQGAIPGFVQMLACGSEQTVMCCLEALERILEVGHSAKVLNDGVNLNARYFEEAKGIDAMEWLQSQEMDERIVDKAVDILRRHFDGEDIVVDDAALVDEAFDAPAVVDEDSVHASFGFGVSTGKGESFGF